MTGGSQDVFVSGAALAVDCDSDIGFFPDIYNEDWFFFFDAASKGQLGNSYLKATQLVYYPFANAERAAWQEFGDVLAEGLYALLHLRMDVEQATSVYWAFFLEARRNFLEDTLSRAEEAPLDMRDEIIASTPVSPEVPKWDHARLVRAVRRGLASGPKGTGSNGGPRFV